MANTIQKKIKFSKGQIVPELVERTDMDFYDSSAQEMKNVVSSVYGGVRSRRGTKKIDRMLGGMTEISATATTGLGGNSSYIQDKVNYYVSDVVGTNRGIFELDCGEEKPLGTVSIRKIQFNYRQPVVVASVGRNVNTYFQGSGSLRIPVYTDMYYYENIYISDPGIGCSASDLILPNPEAGWEVTPSFAFTVGDNGALTSAVITNAGVDGCYLSLGVHTNPPFVPSSNLIYRRLSNEWTGTATFYYSSDGENWTPVSTKNIGETPQDFDFSISEPFRYVKFVLNEDQSFSYKTTLQFQYVGVKTGQYEKKKTKIVDFVYNNMDKYVFVLTDQLISIYKDDLLNYTLTATGLLDTYYDDLKWSYKDDTIVFTHQDMKPKILKRSSDGTWTFGDLDIDNIPYTAFAGETKTTKTVGITPSATDGSIKITAASSIFTSDWVGQYIDGNGGRVKITEFISGTVVNGYTVIPFYTTDQITSWTYISGYKPVWGYENPSDTTSTNHGYPRTCLFAQQRLWFGGSKDKPSTVWASRLGDYFNFKNSGNYDNDAIDVDLLTNDVIVNMSYNRGLHIFTTGQEISSPEGTYTPDKIAFTVNTQNGSLKTVEPVSLNGVLCFIEKNGKSLLSYVYDDNQAAYTTDNLSMLSNLIKAPVAMAAEVNSSKDKGDFLYIVLEDGTMLTACVVVSQKIMSLSQFKTDGLIKDVCCIGSDTYLIVDRGNYNYIEKIDDIPTDVTTNITIISPEDIELYCWKNENQYVYTKSETPSQGDYTCDRFGEDTENQITATEDDTITVNSVVYTRYENGDTEADKYISVLSDYNNKDVVVYDDNFNIIINGTPVNGRLEIENDISGNYYIGLKFDYRITGNPIAINHKTTSIKKRITTAEIVCKDTPQLEFCGQKKTGHDNYKFFSCTNYGDDIRYTIQGEFYKMQILSIQLNINYEG